MNTEIDRIQNAIRHIESSLDVDPWAMEIAVKAMQKQIPKKVNYKVEDRFIKSYLSIYSYCPVCEKEVFAGDMFCVRCGQRICWREEET